MAMIHITRGTTSLGTFPEEEVREGLRAGRFGLTDLGWREGMTSWQPLSSFPEFGGAAPPPATSTIGPSVAGPAGVAPAPRSGLPWENRQGRPFLSTFVETLSMVLAKPGTAFTVMKREGGLGEPLIYALVGGSFGLIISFLIGLLVPSLASFGQRDNPLAHLVGAGIGLVFLVILIPVLIVLGMFIGSAILHLCLMIVGGANQSFETTFRVICFSAGSTYPLLIVPFCGGLISGVWGIVLNCIGLARAHETDTGRAVLAVFLPLIVCCGGGFLLAVLFGGIGALTNWGQ